MGFVRRCERGCWAALTRIPLVIVYSLTTWAVYVNTDLSLIWVSQSSKGYFALVGGFLLYSLLVWSYTVCCFSDPGSPKEPLSNSSRHAYTHLPTHEPRETELPSFTVKSTGEARFCKKCQSKKPDRAHHCSTCRRCVLKMDHHCPWLATCVGFRNYKAFVLFLAYTTLFCWLCFATSASFVWSEIASETLERNGGLLGVNMVLLAVLAGIIGVVLSGFTGWHFSLAMRNQTTIECLESTRYSSPIKKTMERAAHAVGTAGIENPGRLRQYGQQLAEAHANAIPGVTRSEEGIEPALQQGEFVNNLSARDSLRMNYGDIERQREQQRYEDYLDERDSEKLPHAFDLGWRRNLGDIFGGQALLWILPILNSRGDGWRWEPSPKWLAARERIRLDRETSQPQYPVHHPPQAPHRNGANIYNTSFHDEDNETVDNQYLTTSNGIATVPHSGRRSPNKANQILGRVAGQYADEGFSPSAMSMKTIRRREEEEDTASIDGIYQVDNDEDEDESDDSSPDRRAGGIKKGERPDEADWNRW